MDSRSSSSFSTLPHPSRIILSRLVSASFTYCNPTSSTIIRTLRRNVYIRHGTLRSPVPVRTFSTSAYTRIDVSCSAKQKEETIVSAISFRTYRPHPHISHIGRAHVIRKKRRKRFGCQSDANRIRSYAANSNHRSDDIAMSYKQTL